MWGWQAAREGWDIMPHCRVYMMRWRYGLLHFKLIFLQAEIFWCFIIYSTKVSTTALKQQPLNYMTFKKEMKLLWLLILCVHFFLTVVSAYTYKTWTTGLWAGVCPPLITDVWNQTSLVKIFSKLTMTIDSMREA